MKITAIELLNVRGFRRLERTAFSDKINILVGANNSGKSTIINSIYSIQSPTAITLTDSTVGEQDTRILLYFKGTSSITDEIETGRDPRLLITPGNNSLGVEWRFPKLESAHQTRRNIPLIEAKEPNNIIYPFLSRRKVIEYSHVINGEVVNSVEGNFRYLFSKVDRISSPSDQGNKEFVKHCQEILNLEISTMGTPSGKEAGQIVHQREYVPTRQMGEGVANILALIIDLCVAENKIFLIEEPENDIHPKALKKLLEVIIHKSEHNQFFISTHSNIVIKYLGSAKDSKILKVENESFDNIKKGMKLSTMTEVSNDSISRKQILEDLGYDMFDYELWRAWLFLEESSAEVIVREYLIPWFVPTLVNKLRTFSAGSVSKVKPKFEDFNKLFVFLHLEPAYKNNVWVYIDSGEDEKKIIDEMKELYTKSGWQESGFNQFSKHDFERYYPEEFQEKVDKILKESKEKKFTYKKALLNELKVWIGLDEGKAKLEFEKSFHEVIQILHKINEKLK